MSSTEKDQFPLCHVLSAGEAGVAKGAWLLLVIEKPVPA